jgi:ribonuclease BN (tRNA processing enzyme)
MYVADVGDGLCMALRSSFGETIQIDCGSQQGSHVALHGLMKFYNHFSSPDIFMLSHFHLDHYNGLMLASSMGYFPIPWEIKEVYYPKIPKFRERDEFTLCLFTMNLRVFGSETGIMQYDFLKTIFRINRKSFSYKSVSKGDLINIGGTSFEVLWPPAVIDEEGTLPVVRQAIIDFNIAMEADEKIKELYHRVEKEELFRGYFEEGQRSYSEERDDPSKLVNNEYKEKKLPDVVKKANDSLRKAANHLSLALFGDNGVLFLGDLENFEIKEVVNYLESVGKKRFYVFVTPHHGTYWDNCLKKIDCIYSITSNGSKLHSHIKRGFKDISRMSFATYVNGDIVVPPFLPTRSPQFYPWWFYDDKY